MLYSVYFKRKLGGLVTVGYDTGETGVGKSYERKYFLEVLSVDEAKGRARVGVTSTDYINGGREETQELGVHSICLKGNTLGEVLDKAVQDVDRGFFKKFPRAINELEGLKRGS